MDNSTFSSVINTAKEIKTLESVLDLLSWDQETMMPQGANCHRTEQMALLAGLIHDKKNEPRYIEHIAQLHDNLSGTSTDEAIIIERLHTDIQQAIKLPTEYVRRLTRATSEAFSAWQKAKKNNDWPLFQPHLEHLVTLMREKSEYLGYAQHPLDALLNIFEPGATVQELSPFFSSLYTKLTDLLPRVQKSPLYNQVLIPISSTPAEQMQLCTKIVSLLGFNWHCGRIDTSEHPFSTAFHPTDSRITIRSSSNTLLDQLSSALHEAGHGMYELGLNQTFYGTALGESASHGIHEGQSRFWETIIGQSKAFSTHLFNLLNEHYGSKNPISSPDLLYRQINNVVPSPIRTKADEVTYPFHVILRFEIEKELLEGSLKVAQVPERWNEALKKSLGICPKTASQGCLQDVHWSFGNFGYFPTYTLGSLYAICLAKAMRKDLPNMDQLIHEANFKPICNWLSTNVWCHGRRFHSKDLITKILGRPPSEDDYIEYLQEKYTVA